MTESAKAPPLDPGARDAVYAVIHSRRDVRHGYVQEPLPEPVLSRLLAAAHCAPSVGLMQPSRFIVIRSLDLRTQIRAAFERANARALDGYQGERRKEYAALKLEGILEAPQNLCIVCDPHSEHGHGLGRQTMPETAQYSTVCAVQNLWLAARAEGVGVGWVSILAPDELRAILGIPAHVVPVAYLCLGFVDAFGAAPELERVGWEQRRPLGEVVFSERYGQGSPE